jgi:hypothetical protein
MLHVSHWADLLLCTFHSSQFSHTISGFQLMGFKPLSHLSAAHNIKSANFIYPDEHATAGSTVAFRALSEEMAAQNKFAVARASIRKSGIPRFVALLPQVRMSHSQTDLDFCFLFCFLSAHVAACDQWDVCVCRHANSWRL